MHRGLSCSDVDLAVFGAVESPGWRGGQENRSPSSSSREIRSGGRVMSRGSTPQLCRLALSWARATRCQCKMISASPPGIGAGSVPTGSALVRTCTSNVPHDFPPPPATLSTDYLPQHIPGVSSSLRDRLYFGRRCGCAPVDQAPPSVLGHHSVNPSDCIFILGSAHLVGRAFHFNPVLVPGVGLFLFSVPGIAPQVMIIPARSASFS